MVVTVVRSSSYMRPSGEDAQLEIERLLVRILVQRTVFSDGGGVLIFKFFVCVFFLVIILVSCSRMVKTLDSKSRGCWLEFRVRQQSSPISS